MNITKINLAKTCRYGNISLILSNLMFTRISCKKLLTLSSSNADKRRKRSIPSSFLKCQKINNILWIHIWHVQEQLAALLPHVTSNGILTLSWCRLHWDKFKFLSPIFRNFTAIFGIGIENAINVILCLVQWFLR